VPATGWRSVSTRAVAVVVAVVVVAAADHRRPGGFDRAVRPEMRSSIASFTNWTFRP
jgi:hypothetical protein